MKKKFLLPILLLATLSLGGGLVACNQTGNKSSQAGESYSVAISNKEAFAEWYAGTNRDLDLTLTPEANALQELNEGNLTVASSDETVVKPSGLGLAALKAGTAKITVSYHGAEDSLDVTVIDNSAKAKYGVAHAGTAEDPFTNEDALAVAKSEKYEGEVYYVKGKVASFYNAPGSRDDGMVAWFLEPATAGGEKFEIYKCFKEGGGKLTDDDIWVGGEATAYGAFTVYGTQYETSSATFVKCEGNKPAPRQTLTKTFAETLAAGVALADGDQTWDYYKFQAYVTVKSGNDYFLTATKGEALVAGKSDAAHGEKDIKGTNAIELYGAGKVEAVAAKLLEGAKVEVTMIVKNYHGTVENGLALADADVTVIEAGKAWAVPEPTVASKTVTEFVALENNKKNAYKVTATIKSWKSAAADQYGNMTITDGTTDLVIYGASATQTALAWDGAGEYAFTNPKDFLTNDVTKALQVGDKLVMKLIRADYTKDGNTTIQGTGVILEVVAPDAPATKTIAITAANLLGYAGTNVAYPSDSTPVTATVDGMGLAAVGCGAYGDGIQMRTKNGIVSAVYNTTEADINKLEFVWAATKDVTAGKEYNLWVEFSNKADFSELVGTKQNVKVDATSKLGEAVPTAAAKYFKVSHPNQGAVYLDAINVVINEAAAEHEHAWGDPTTVAKTETVSGYKLSECSTCHKHQLTMDGHNDDLNGKITSSYKLDNNNDEAKFVFPAAAGKGKLLLKLAYGSGNGGTRFQTGKNGGSSKVDPLPDNKTNTSLKVNGVEVELPNKTWNELGIEHSGATNAGYVDLGEVTLLATGNEILIKRLDSYTPYFVAVTVIY